MKKLVAIILVTILSVMMISSTALAANVCKEFKGSSKKTTTFTVNTGSRWFSNTDKLTLKQTKGTLAYHDWLYRPKTFSAYDSYTVTYKTGKTSKTVNWTGGSLTLKLKENKVYTITIKPANLSTLQARYMGKGAIDKWKKVPTWKVTSTKGIEFCEW